MTLQTLRPPQVVTKPMSTRSKRAFVAPQEVCTELVRLGSPHEVKAGEIIFCKGQPGNGVFLINSGRVALSAGDDPARITRITEPGSLLGLPATVTGHRYSLTAEAVTDTSLICVGIAEFRQVLKENPTLCYSVIRMLAEEIRALRRAAVYTL